MHWPQYLKSLKIFNKFFHNSFSTIFLTGLETVYLTVVYLNLIRYMCVCVRACVRACVIHLQYLDAVTKNFIHLGFVISMQLSIGKLELKF